MFWLLAEAGGELAAGGEEGGEEEGEEGGEQTYLEEMDAALQTESLQLGWTVFAANHQDLRCAEKPEVLGW